MAAEPTISDVLAAIGGLGARFDTLEARIGSLEARIGSLEGRFGTLEGRIDTLEAVVKDIQDHLKAQPDMRLMFANGKVTLEKIVEIEGEIRMLRSAINDHARGNVTPGEMEAVHHDLALIRHEQLSSAARLQRIEAVLNLEPNG